MNQAILASSNQPVLMPPVEVKSNTDSVRQYVDGGVREYVPLRVAVENGATEIFAIYLSPKERKQYSGEFQEALPTSKSKKDKNRTSIVERTLDLFLGDVFENDLNVIHHYNETISFHEALKKRLVGDFNVSPNDADDLFEAADKDKRVKNPFSGKRIIRLYEIYPEAPLDAGSLDVKPVQMSDMEEIGYQRAKQLLKDRRST